jgi:hypothetical protein
MAALLLFDSVFISLIKYLARKVSGNVHACDRYQFCLVLRFAIIIWDFSWWSLCCSCWHVFTCLHVFSSALRYPVRFPRKNDVRFIYLDSHLLCGGFRFIYVNCIYLRILVYDFSIRWCSFRLTVAQRVPHVEQKLLTLATHMSSPQFVVGFVFLDFQFSV